MRRDNCLKYDIIGILLMPVRIIIAVGVFTPIYLILIFLTKMGEWLEETCSNLAGSWFSMGKEWQYLTNGKQLDQAIEAVQENKILKEQLRLYENL